MPWLNTHRTAGESSCKSRFPKVGDVLLSEVFGRWINNEEDHLHGDPAGSLPTGARKDLTDRQWRLLEPLLPKGKKPGRPRTWT